MVKGVKLVIVESPTKAKTLSRFLGSDYVIEATMGHVRDLPKSKLGVDVEHHFAPEYVVIEKRKETIEKLIQLAKQKAEIILATDPDREGESIAWHVQELLKHKSTRIVFHEITKQAIEAALQHPGRVNLQLVEAQQARRVVDRLVGYKLSPLLWKKVRRGLSAGRVQSVTVRLVVEREKEIGSFKPQEFWEIKVQVAKVARVAQVDFWLDLAAKVTTGKQAEAIKADLEAAEYRIAKIERKRLERASLPPFKTSTLQQAGASRWGWSSRRTMRSAQALYERGLITYHRTDSLNLSREAVEKVRAYINSTYGREYVPENLRYFKTTSKLVQEAHEAIRPTEVNDKLQIINAKLGKDEERLYQLIWKRFVASQMEAARFDKTNVNVTADEYLLRAEGVKMLFDGWLKVYGSKTDDQLLPELKEGDRLIKKEVVAEQKFTEAPARYTEASLIKTLEKLGIGRPSTYAPTISTIQVRQYVEKKEQKFYSTPVGVAVTEFLAKYFPKIMDYQFTAQMEDDLDKIAAGKALFVPVVGEFYEPFEQDVARVETKAARVKVPTEATGQQCPQCQKGEVVIRLGRFGKFLSCSRFPKCKYTANYVETVAGVNCPKCGSEVVIRRTKKGKQFYGCSTYPKCDWAAWKLGKKTDKVDKD
jgi:DNA topoisomerase I